MTTILINFKDANGNNITEPQMNSFFDQIDLDFVKKVAIRDLLNMVGTDVNGGHFISFEEWLGEEIGWQETPRMAKNRIEFNRELVENFKF